MGGRTGVGAAIGLWVGLALIAWLILLPRAQQGSFYEVGDPLIVMGVPLLLLGVAVGASAGSAVEDKASGAPSRWVTTGGPALGLVGLALAASLLLWGTGLVGTPH